MKISNCPKHRHQRLIPDYFECPFCMIKRLMSRGIEDMHNEIATLREAFRHTYVPKRDDKGRMTGQCYGCGLDMRNPVHRQLGEESLQSTVTDGGKR